jgi:hypothetical protein
LENNSRNEYSFDQHILKVESLIAKQIERLGERFWVKYEEVLDYYKNQKTLSAEEAFVELLKLSDDVNKDKEDKQYLASEDNRNHSQVSEPEVEYFQSKLIRYSFDQIIPTKTTEPKSIIINETKKIQKVLYDIYRDNSNLYTLNCWEFEEMIAELLSNQGYKVELTQKTRDNGYDILALMNIKMHSPLKFLVECKHYTKQKIGINIINGFETVINKGKANRGIIVTTSYFTKPAVQRQQEIPYLLDYRDKDKVIEWVTDYFNNKVD